MVKNVKVFLPLVVGFVLFSFSVSAVQIVRTLPAAATTIDGIVDVQMSFINDGQILNSYEIEETFPAGWELVAGTANPAPTSVIGTKLKWLQFEFSGAGVPNKVFSYKVKVKSTSATFSGNIKFTPTGGTLQTIPASGSTSVSVNSGTSEGGATSGGGSTGSGSGSGSGSTSGGGGGVSLSLPKVTRVLPTAQVSEVSLVDVKLEFDNSGQILNSYEIEETFPAGWELVAGTANPAPTSVIGTKLKWLQFEFSGAGVPNKVFSYRVRAGTSTQPQGVFSGNIKFTPTGGTLQTIQTIGPTTVTVSSQPPKDTILTFLGRTTNVWVIHPDAKAQVTAPLSELAGRLGISRFMTPDIFNPLSESGIFIDTLDQNLNANVRFLDPLAFSDLTAGQAKLKVVDAPDGKSHLLFLASDDVSLRRLIDCIKQDTTRDLPPSFDTFEIRFSQAQLTSCDLVGIADSDGDGDPSDTDCDDANKDKFRKNIEKCNDQIDSDCDGNDNTRNTVVGGTCEPTLQVGGTIRDNLFEVRARARDAKKAATVIGSNRDNKIAFNINGILGLQKTIIADESVASLCSSTGNLAGLDEIFIVGGACANPVSGLVRGFQWLGPRAPPGNCFNSVRSQSCEILRSQANICNRNIEFVYIAGDQFHDTYRCGNLIRLHPDFDEKLKQKGILVKGLGISPRAEDIEPYEPTPIVT